MNVEDYKKLIKIIHEALTKDMMSDMAMYYAEVLSELENKGEEQLFYEFSDINNIAVSGTFLKKEVSV
jgi:hypothetical protein